MTYEGYKAKMQSLLTAGFRYTPGQIGFQNYAEKMAELAESYPEYDERLENENLNG